MRRPLLAVATLLLAGCGGGSEPREAPPNIVFVLVDDLGWKDPSYAGSAYPTPNIDRLARLGMVFHQAYAASPVCSPTRAAILTGRHPARLRITRAIRNKDYLEYGKPPPPGVTRLESRVFLPLEETTFATRLADAGYDTAFVGKWHLGLPPFVPERHGFATTIATSSMSASPYFPPYEVKHLGPAEPGEYLTDRLTDEAVAFVRRERDRPFLLFLAHYAVHRPHMAKPELVERFRRELDPARPQHDPVYAAMLASVDESVGRLLDALEEQGLLERTVFVLTSDNGPLVEGPEPVTETAPLRGGKLELYEGGLRVPLVVAWPGTIAAGASSDVPVLSTDFHPTLLELAGLEPLAGVPLDGIDLGPLLRGGPPPPTRALPFHFPHHRQACSALRVGDEKLIHYYAGGDELYDLARDPGETRDLSGERPERAAELRRQLLAWLESVDAALPASGAAHDDAADDDGGE